MIPGRKNVARDQHRHAARWQHSEILGARPATLLQLMQGLPPGHLPKAP